MAARHSITFETYLKRENFYSSISKLRLLIHSTKLYSCRCKQLLVRVWPKGAKAQEQDSGQTRPNNASRMPNKAFGWAHLALALVGVVGRLWNP